MYSTTPKIKILLIYKNGTSPQQLQSVPSPQKHHLLMPVAPRQRRGGTALCSHTKNTETFSPLTLPLVEGKTSVSNYCHATTEDLGRHSLTMLCKKHSTAKGQQLLSHPFQSLHTWPQEMHRKIKQMHSPQSFWPCFPDFFLTRFTLATEMPSITQHHCVVN